MIAVPDRIETWQMTATKKMERAALGVPALEPGEVLVKVAGCGICRSDLAAFFGEVPSATPRTLGHEISGTVIAGDAELAGREVIIPAVMPCHSCPICLAGRENRCLAAKIPGYSMGIYGGNSSHIAVPAADLCLVGERKGIPLASLAVVADAVASAYQAAKRAELRPGDMAVVVGATGCVGVYATQICMAMGAREIVGIARDPERLERMRAFGATHVISAQGKTARGVRDEFYAYCAGKGLPRNHGWKVFEWTGTAAGQEIALELLPFAGRLVVGGFGMHKNEFPLSRVMALEADILGSWACPPRYYPEILDMVLGGAIRIEPFVRTMPMSRIEEAYEEAYRGGRGQRIVLIPDF